MKLTAAAHIPVGSVIDTRQGRIGIIAAQGKGKKASADFYDGLFKLTQTKGGKRIVTLALTEKLTGCKAKGKAATAKKKKRRLWGDGKGRFTTKGKHSAATVVGTKWLVEDRCTSTLTRVARGKARCATSPSARPCSCAPASATSLARSAGNARSPRWYSCRDDDR